MEVPRDGVETKLRESHRGEEAAGLLTSAIVTRECVRHGLYRTPSCNDKLYLHRLGLTHVDADALCEFTDVRVLWLEGNALRTLQKVVLASQLRTVRQLYLHGNCFHELPEVIRYLEVVDSINLGENFIKNVVENAWSDGWEGWNAEVWGQSNGKGGFPRTPWERRQQSITLADAPPNLVSRELDAVQAEGEHEDSPGAFDGVPFGPPRAICVTLSTLCLRRNGLADVGGLLPLMALRGLTCLDLSHNAIEDASIISLMAALPGPLYSLYLHQNPFLRSTPCYRKRVLFSRPSLRHLDEKPVDAKERRLVDRWACGGRDGESAEMKKMREEEEEQQRSYVRMFRATYGVLGEENMKEPRQKDENGELENNGAVKSSSSESEDEEEGNIHVPSGR